VIVPVGAMNLLGSGAGISPIGGLGTSVAPTTGSTTGGSFADALSGAIGSVQDVQNTANTAATQLATGQLSDPTTAITAVEQAQLTMELASQVSSKATQDVQSIFATQL
jgi:flagellar hook-basal body complex protein FliE